MVDSFVQVPPDSTGKQIATYVVSGKQQQVVSLADSSGIELSSTSMPMDTTPAIVVRQAPLKYIETSYANSGNGVDTSKETLIATGAGMAVNRTGGNLVITTGTTANSETVIRGVTPVNGAMTWKEVTTFSQRIVNNNFYAELVDVIGDGLTYNIVSSVLVDVTKTAHGFGAVTSIGQRIDICAITGAAGIPMEGVISSIPDANTIRFTVSGWPATGTGTCSLTGWNKVELLYTGVSSTVVSFNTRRQGWQNTAVNATVNNTSGAVLTSININNGLVSYADVLSTTTTSSSTNRNSWPTNVPEPTTTLYYQMRAKNGTVAPASTTTWTVGVNRIEDYVPSQVELVGTRQQSIHTSLPVNVTFGTISALTGGSVAEDSATTSNPHIIGGIVRTAVTPVTLIAGDAVRHTMTNSGAQTVKPYSVPEVDWSYAAASGGIINTTDVVLKAAAGASIRNYLTSISIQNASATIATEVVVKDGSTVIFRGYVGTSALLNSVVNVTFPSPLKSTANTALNVACITTASAVYVNAQGYEAA